jgi:hypothetical protein
MYLTIGPLAIGIVMPWYGMHRCAAVVAEVRREGVLNHGNGWRPSSFHAGKPKKEWGRGRCEEMKSIER